MEAQGIGDPKMRKYTMKKRHSLFVLLWACVTVFCFTVVFVPVGSAQQSKKHKWWEVTPEEENPSPDYDSILYSEIAPRLHEITENSSRVMVQVMGQSAAGRDLYLAIVAAPGDEGRFGHYQNLRRLMIHNPEKAQAMIEVFDDFKVPVFINGSIHGREYPGTDACIRLIETLAYDDSEEVQGILDNIILLVNVCQNPDGRVLGTRQNSVGFDLNRDMITQTQPETRATARVIAKWNPMTFLDLHGFINPMLIEPCTPPHNPNYEYDLYLEWAYSQALAMSKELFAQTDETEVNIPYLDSPDGWDDWPPIYAASYPMMHGAYGHTLETPYRDERGVDAHYAAVWGALKFVVENRKEMIHDQIEIYRRGFFDLPQVLIPDALLAETPWDQFNELTIQEFPAAYVIPADKPFQQSSHQAANVIDFLLFNGVQVDKTTRTYWIDGTNYPGGTYIVWMDQPKRGLANTILEDGMDLSDIHEGLTFYSPPAAWSHPLLWGVTRAVMEEKMDIRTRPVIKAKAPKGSMDFRSGNFFAYQPSSIAAFQATNDFLAQGITVFRATESFSDYYRTVSVGTFIIPKDLALVWDLVKKYKLDIFTIRELPATAMQLTNQSIAVFADEGTTYCLRELGFAYDELTTDNLNSGIDLSQYDVLIQSKKRWLNSLNNNGKSTLKDFIEAGGDFIGAGSGGAGFAESTGLFEITFLGADGNGIVNIDYDPSDPVAAGFREDSYAFVYDPVWFSDLSATFDIVASLDDGDFFVSGFWPDWKNSNAGGKPIIVHAEVNSQDITLIGNDPTFRGHPRDDFRIIGNAIYSGLE
jgi:hypothetical protein